MQITETYNILRQLSVSLDASLNESKEGCFLTVNNQEIDGQFKAVKLFPGLEIITVNIHAKAAFNISNFFKHKDALHFIFCFEGCLKHQFSNETQCRDINRLQNVILGGNSTYSSNFSIEKDTIVKASIITITNQVIDNKKFVTASRLSVLLKDLIANIDRSKKYAYFGDISVECSKYFKQIMDNDCIGLANRLLFEASVFKMLSTQFKSFTKAEFEKDKKVSSLNQTDRSKVIALSEYITNNLSSTLTIAELEKVSGLNQKKIQKGFRLFFDESINKFITNLRILKSKELIETTDLSMSEIVYNIGFNSRSYFSKIFAKRYGLLPTEYKKHHHLSHPTFEYCYYSKANAKINAEDISDIIEVSRTNNLKKGLNGCLIYHDSYFFQILEGPKEEVLKLMKNINKDSRHKQVIKLYEGVKSGRYFKEWQMALIDNSPTFFKDQKAVTFLNPEISVDLLKNKGLNSTHFWEKTRNHLLVEQLKKDMI
tara:strand:+ start:1517 stop:2971 length:1455 start_codon:yes stop_codon:yes gene_type:complete